MNKLIIFCASLFVLMLAFIGVINVVNNINFLSSKVDISWSQKIEQIEYKYGDYLFLFSPTTKDYQKPEDLIGKESFVVVTNYEKKIKGIYQLDDYYRDIKINNEDIEIYNGSNSIIIHKNTETLENNLEFSTGEGSDVRSTFVTISPPSINMSNGNSYVEFEKEPYFEIDDYLFYLVGFVQDVKVDKLPTMEENYEH